jgi:hypothetical protein
MKRKLTSIGLMAALFAVLLPLGAASAQKKATSSPETTFPVSFVGTTAAGAVNFVGTLSVKKFDVQNDQVVAIGNLTGQVTGAVTGLVQNLGVTIPLIDANQEACEILHLELGPIDLNLLGLVVHVDQIVVDITAQPGPGNLLGNLLCAIAGLLDQPGAPLNIIADLLNSLLDLLRFLR